MNPENMNELCRQCFKEIIFDNSEYSNRTYCYLDPFRGKDNQYHITLVDKATSYGVTLPLSSKACMLLEKKDIKVLFQRVMQGLAIAVKKYSSDARPVDYKAKPLKAVNKLSVYNKTETKEKTSIEFYSWSRILV